MSLDCFCFCLSLPPFDVVDSIIGISSIADAADLKGLFVNIRLISFEGILSCCSFRTFLPSGHVDSTFLSFRPLFFNTEKVNLERERAQIRITIRYLQK